MENKRNLIYLAALLHDIGKFYQRADEPFNNKQVELSEYSKNIANALCPVNDKGKFGYQHVVWTNEFFEKVKDKLYAIPGIKENLFEVNDEDCLANLACNHHKPQSIFQSIITMADWWSAGVDRREPIEKEEAEDKLTKINWGKTRYKHIPLFSIFNIIKGGTSHYAFPLEKLDISGKEFPKEIKKFEDGLSQEKYKALWKDFLEEFSYLPTDSINGFTESLTFLLKKYTWCIPSNTMDMANVSLYDHLKTTAAFADCLYSYYIDYECDFKWDNTNKLLTLDEKKYPVLLLGCDISGIQKFIYNIASRKAATSLKGRSFYLQLLIDSIIQRFIMHDDIKAGMANVVYSSGGKFYMLLPNTAKVQKAIEQIVSEIEREIWQQHKGKLIVNIDYIPFAYKNKTNEVDFAEAKSNEKDLGKLWKSLAEKLTEKKNKKFKNILLENYSDFFEPIPSGGDVKVCAVTGEELKKGEFTYLKDSDKVISNTVKEQINLGETLKDVDYLITFKGNEANANYLSNRLKHKTTIFGVANYLFDQTELTDDNADFRKITSADVSRVKRINNTKFLAAPLKGKRVSYGFQFYGGNKQAEYDSKRDRTFEELTRREKNDPNSETYFGVLRMDVDGLGEIFIRGLNDDQKTFSAYATLSSALDCFFSGYLNTIREKYKDNVNIIYSGGDDVFAVGRWDLLIAFAEDIRASFRRFVGREDISISGGIAIVNNNYPIAKAAELAGDAEHSAKQFIDKKLGQKNAINFLGKTVSWNQEFDEVKSLKNELVNLITKQGMSKSILHRLMLFASIQEKNKINKEKNPKYEEDLRYYWNAAYYLKRFTKDKPAAVVTFCENLKNTMFVQPRNLEKIALAARWAELEIKEFN